jgi:hypothetical protein
VVSAVTPLLGHALTPSGEFLAADTWNSPIAGWQLTSGEFPAVDVCNSPTAATHRARVAPRTPPTHLSSLTQLGPLARREQETTAVVLAALRVMRPDAA